MKKRFICLIAITITLFSTMIAASGASQYYYSTKRYTDYVSCVTTQDLGKHPHNYRDIGARYINVTAPSSQTYYLHLKTRTNLIYSEFGNRVIANTSGLGGMYFWANSNPDEISNKYAYIWIEKSNNGVSLGGSLESTSRVWQ